MDRYSLHPGLSRGFVRPAAYPRIRPLRRRRPTAPVQLTLYLLILYLCAPPSLIAQDRGDQPRRPRLQAPADSNDAQAYYQFGVEAIAEDPDRAADAFYWAARLDPSWAAPLHARRAALMLKDKKRLVRYMQYNRSLLESPEIRAIDSLVFRADQRDPFLYRDFEALLGLSYVKELVWQLALREFSSAAAGARRSLEAWVDSLVRADTTAQTQAWLAYGERRFTHALVYYARMLESDEYDRARVHLERGRVHFLLGNLDLAQEALAQALEELRQRDEDELVIWYESKAMLEYTLGYAFESAGDVDAAREGYARALIEDLSFHPAHLRLGVLGLMNGDTLTALTEFELAAESAPDEPMPRLFYGFTLYQTGNYRDAAPQLEQVIALEPYYAEPYYILGLVREALGDREGAASSYDSFVARCVASDERREVIAQRASVLRGR